MGFFMERLKELPKGAMPINGIDGYFIIKDGRVFSNRKPGMGSYYDTYKEIKGSISKGTKSAGGYKLLITYENKIPKGRYFHRLMWETFVGKIPEDMQINHKDGIKLNNVLDNLEIVTHHGNVRHAKENHLYQEGENHWGAGLTESNVLEIRKLYEAGWPPSDLANVFGTGRTNIHEIVSRRNWQHI